MSILALLLYITGIIKVEMCRQAANYWHKKGPTLRVQKHHVCTIRYL